MDKKYHLRFTGLLKDGLSREDVVTKLASLTNLDREKAAALLSSGRSVLLKKNSDLETVEKYRMTFEKAGMITQIVDADIPSTLKPAPLKTEPQQPATPPNPSPTQELPPSEPPPQKIEIQENPYAAPKSNLKVKKETKGQWLNEPQKVPASHGWYWLKSAVPMFFQQPWIWMGMGLVLFLIIVVLSMIPLVGPLSSGLLSAVLNGGLMLAAQAQTKGEQVKVSHVFRGFNHNRNQLFLVGLYYLLVFGFFGVIIGILMGTNVFTGVPSGDPGTTTASLRGNTPLIGIIFLLISLLTIPFTMAYWFAPALVALADQSAWNAYKLSFRACRKNWPAFLVFSLALLVVGIIFILIFSSVSGVLAYFIFQKGSFLVAFLPLIMIGIMGIPLASIMGLTIFTSFKDIYYQTA
jgi:hypothetical protein